MKEARSTRRTSPIEAYLGWAHSGVIDMPDLLCCRTKGTVAVAIVIVLSLGLPVFGDEAARTWTDSTGKHTRDATFVEVKEGLVVLKLTDGGVVRIPMEKLSSADQSYAKNAALATAANTDPFQTDTTIQDSKTRHQSMHVGSKSASSSINDTLRVVVAEGVGVDVESARSDAFRQAVRQVVGAFVDAGTMVANDQLIEDRVITLSSGLVEKTEPVSESKSGGLVRIRIRASVRVTRLLETLNANRIATASVDTDSLVAKVTTTADQQESFEAILRSTLPRFHEKCFAVSVVGQPSVGKATGDSAEVRVRFALSPNREAFLAVARKLEAAFDATPRQNGEINSNGLKALNNTDVRATVQGIRSDALDPYQHDRLVWIFADQAERHAVDLSADDKGNSSRLTYDPLYLICDPACTGSGSHGIEGLVEERLGGLWESHHTSAVLLLMTNANESCQRTRWRWFHLSADEIKLVGSLLSPIFRCTVKLLDTEGEEIGRDAVRLTNLGVCGNFDAHETLLILAPFWVHREASYYIPNISMERTLTLDKSEIARVSKAEVVLTEEARP